MKKDIGQIVRDFLMADPTNKNSAERLILEIQRLGYSDSVIRNTKTFLLRRRTFLDDQDSIKSDHNTRAFVKPEEMPIYNLISYGFNKKTLIELANVLPDDITYVMSTECETTIYHDYDYDYGDDHDTVIKVEATYKDESDDEYIHRLNNKLEEAIYNAIKRSEASKKGVKTRRANASKRSKHLAERS